MAVSDDGGSSGRLRRDLGLPPPGDIRNCLVALADDEHLLARLFQHRFGGGEGLSGHSFGNLFLAALTEITGDFAQAILTAERILSVKGTILPATLENVALVGTTRGGRRLEGSRRSDGQASRSNGSSSTRPPPRPIRPRSRRSSAPTSSCSDPARSTPRSSPTCSCPRSATPSPADADRAPWY